MNCNGIATILDEHLSARLMPAERSRVDEHLLACADCAAAWHAQTELIALRVPPAPAALLDRVTGAVRAPAGSERHRSRVPLFVASVALAGAALAAVTVATRTQRSPETGEVATELGAPTSSSLPSDGIDARAVDPQPGPLDTDTTNVALIDTGLDLVQLVVYPPEYPPQALERGLEGQVQLEFDVTTTGAVENARVVDASDPLFGPAALDALSRWKYLPRIAAGNRVAALATQTIIRFQLSSASARAVQAPPRAPPSAEPYHPDFATYAAALEGAWAKLTADDWRGAELTLDEIRARYVLDGFQEGTAWSFYAYLYTLDGDYSRAIEAYETGIAAYTRAGMPVRGGWLKLANLYFARHQYDPALKSLLTYKRHAAEARTPGARPYFVPSGVDELIARLRALGVTEETLSPSR